MTTRYSPTRRPRRARRRSGFRRRLSALSRHPATRNLLLGVGGGLGWAAGEHLFRVLPALKRVGRVAVTRRIGF